MSKKDVIYIDIEDDITSIIDRVKDSNSSIVALVPPKRSTVLQSAVNMKLLKKVSDDEDKKIVLITSEASLLPLAGGVGLFVADTLQSRPKIPEIENPDLDESVIEDEFAEEDDSDKKKAVAGAVVGATAVKASKKSKKSADKASDIADTASKEPKSLHDEKIESLKSKSKIPNFQKFRLKMILGIGGVILLVVLWFVAFKIMPASEITIAAQTTRVPVDTSFIASVDAGSTDLENKILVAEQKTLAKSSSQQVDATGEKDVGKKASGTMTVQNCDSSVAITLPSGATFKDPSTGNTFTSDSAVKVPGGVFSGGGCSTPGEADVDVTATESGDDKNLSSRTYSVPGYGGTVTAFGGQMSGGTTKIVKVVSQEDVDKAKQSLQERTHSEEREELITQFGDSSYVLGESFVVYEGDTTSEPAVGEESAKVTVTIAFNYSMLAVQEDTLNQFLESDEKQQLGDGDQAILDTGLSNAAISLQDKVSETNMTFSIITTGYAGPQLDTEALKEEIKGKRYSEAISILERKDGVNTVTIDLSPFWVSNIPTNTGKINIDIEVSDSTLQ